MSAEQLDGVPERALKFSNQHARHEEKQAHPNRYRQGRKNRAAFVATQIAEGHFEELEHKSVLQT
jgi:hypothetical protein